MRGDKSKNNDLVGEPFDRGSGPCPSNMKKTHTEEETFERLVYGKCDRCNRTGLEPHTCPYTEEINEDYETMCNCCERCSHECAMDI